ncbi:MAG: ATP-binding protein, partial [Chitinivibrionales bacterium]|nr:ATP-binding protein [Chitinivibrionales bacterium]
MPCRGTIAVVASLYIESCFLGCIQTFSAPHNIMQRIEECLIFSGLQNLNHSLCIGVIDATLSRVCYTMTGSQIVLLKKCGDAVTFLRPTRSDFISAKHRRQHESCEVPLAADDVLFWYCAKSGFHQKRKTESGSLSAIELFFRINFFESAQQWCDTFADIFPNRAQSHIGPSTHLLAAQILSQSQTIALKKKLGFAPAQPVQIQYLSSYEEIEYVSARILKDMDHNGFSDESIRRMKLSITELVANAIDHGNKNSSLKRVTLGHCLEPQRITVAVLDEGEGFDPDTVVDPTLPENLTKDHGRGLFIVKNYCDEITFNSTGNRVLIRKYRKNRRIPRAENR